MSSNDHLFPLIFFISSFRWISFLWNFPTVSHRYTYSYRIYLNRYSSRTTRQKRSTNQLTFIYISFLALCAWESGWCEQMSLFEFFTMWMMTRRDTTAYACIYMKREKDTQANEKNIRLRVSAWSINKINLRNPIRMRSLCREQETETQRLRGNRTKFGQVIIIGGESAALSR